MTARVLVAAALVALLAGCGGAHRAVTTAPKTQTHTKPQPKPKSKPKNGHYVIGEMTKLVITILDGDQRVRVRGARVSLWGKTGRTNRHGVTTIKAPRGRHVVSVAARGYGHARIPVDFSENRWHTIDVYRPELQWPLYGATAARTQAPEQIRLRPPFRLIWSRGLGGLIEFPAAVVDGVAYVGNARSTVHAISMRDGKFVWVHRTPGWPRMASSPAIVGNEIVYHTMGGRVYVLNRSDGRLEWSWNAGSAIESSPVVVDGVDYFGNAGGEMYALDLRTHRLKWRRYLGAKITSSAAISGGRLFIGDYAGRLWALSPANGATRWVKTVNGKIYGTPAVAQGRVFIPSSTGNSLTAFTTSGRYLWRDTAGYYVYSSPAVADGVVCWGSYTGWFYGSSAATGRILWRIPTGGPISGAAVIVDGVAYVGSFSHRIIGVNLHTGRRLVTFPHGQYVPVSGNGQRLLFNGFSRIYAVEPRHSKRRQLAH
ncbi:MAG TPA: PQQ-binding-like beta-propeller repeat protein [Gaiellaceae bacterium]|nr:PQQ-binding-like beta-propeller repeat protein [Gaiellaceae bacterium]